MEKKINFYAENPKHILLAIQLQRSETKLPITNNEDKK